jgi:transcriptional regulator with XRE-family HTH domain
LRSVRDDDRAIGQRVKAARRRLGLSLADLAALASVTPAQMEKYESGANPLSAARLATLAEHLGASADDLLGLGAVEAPDSRVSEEAQSLAEAFDRLPPGQLKDGVYRLVLAAAAESLPPRRDPH